MLKQEEYLTAIDGVVKYLEVCQELSAMVVPVEVEYKLIKRTTNTTRSSVALYCKRCRSELSNTLEYRYCPWCGQKLKYNDELYNQLITESKINVAEPINEEMLNNLIQRYVKENQDGDNQSDNS